MKSDYLEVLAPVGSPDSLLSAVRSGADAVYFGCKEFSARRNAENFDFEQMQKAVKYCKENNVKTYLTINIEIKDSEMNAAVSTAENAYKCGVDGLILSDLGLARIIKNRFPDIELHASTQLSINSKSGLKLLKDMGFCRVVPAREMSKEGLTEICKEAKRLGIEVEVFVHGALCMCLSGQCLLSSVLGGRSGNRGLCAGPCRLPFKVKNGTGYDLSLKDLSLYSHIDELKEMGVVSLKIEGRMKRPEYIAAAVTACRQVVDNGYVDGELDKILKTVFSRDGFTDGYFTDRLGKEMFGIRSKDDVIKSKETYSFLHNLYRNELQKIPLCLSLRVKKDEPIELKISAQDKTVSVYGNIPQTAEAKPITKENLTQLLSKLGGTPFFAEKTDIVLDDGIFVPSSEINELRRNATKKLSEDISKPKTRKIVDYNFKAEDISHNKTPLFYGKFSDINQIPDNLSGFDLIILPFNQLPEKLNGNTEYAVTLPRFTENEKKITEYLKKAKEKGIKKALCGNLSAVKLAFDEGFYVLGDIGLNVINEYTADTLAALGLKEITLSAEINLKSAKHLKTKIKKGIFGYGRLPLMCFKNCPVKNGDGCQKCGRKGFITDRTGTVFPIRCSFGFSEMFNSKPIYLADKSEDYEGLDYIILSFTTEEKEECIKILEDYRQNKKPSCDFTRGLYFKDVL